jgi:hypothetical protein
MKLTSSNGRLSCIGCLIVLPFLFMLVLLAGCPQGVGNGNDNDNDNGSPGSGRGEIVTPSSSFGLSLLDPPFQIRYNVPSDATNISGYRFAVADSSLNIPAIGDEVVIATNLQAGSNKFFDFDPSEAGVGFHRVGISFTLDGEADLAESSGVIQVQGSPSPVFILPAQELTVVPEGDTVTVSFDARDPEGEVQWRLFYLDSDDTLSAPADSIGTQLAIGEGNVGTVSFRTEGLAEGDYTLGISATDSGMSVAATVAAGQLDRIVTIPGAGVDTPKIRVVPEGTIITPTITITNPGNTDIELFKDETFTIRFTANVPQEGATGSIEVFYDTDTNVNNGFTIIADNLSDSDTQVQFPSGVPEGTYFIGATIRDGINPPVTDYSTGRVIVTRSITLTVTEPNTTLTVAPNTPVTIRWTTNAPNDAGTVDVFAQRLTSANVPTGAVIPIITAGAMSLRTATFTSSTSGLFQITVRLNLTDETPISQNSPRPVRVSTLPAIAWLGSIAEPEPRLDGAIFGGVNFEDNAGSAFAKADDYDGDGLNEFVIAARYGKPFFINPSGVGPGEAYVIYGERGIERLNGTYNLNSVGTSILRGITLTGVRTIGTSDDTEGLSDCLSIPDADGDGKEELAFGFPYCFNQSTSALSSGVEINLNANSPLSPAPHFERGGIVVLSSTNSKLEDPELGAAVYNLDEVGQHFGGPIEPLDPEIVFDDRYTFEEGDDDADPPVPGACDEGSDSRFDTVIGPTIGFINALAAPQWDWLGGTNFQYIGPNAVEAEEFCRTRFELEVPDGFPDCLFQPFFGANAGSGFFTGPPVEPLGARIIGDLKNGDFGTTISVSHPSGPHGPTELVISAPERGAGGIAYLPFNGDRWSDREGLDPPKPNQYLIDANGACGNVLSLTPSSNTHLIGDSGDMIENIIGIDDFNVDGRGDLAIGAPQAGGGNGRVYIAYRREPGFGGLEGDFILNNLGLDPNNPERLEGLLITTNTNDGLGFSLAQGFDFNDDGISDLVVGSPNANGGTGEVIIVFGGTGILSPAGGTTVQTLLSQSRTAEGNPVAMRIRGPIVGGEKGLFGYNVANAGDVDGDGIDDLLIASPESSPRFDAAPNDAVDELTTVGVDINLDGVRDEVPGEDELNKAGIVYLIFGKNRLDQVRTCQGTTTSCLSASDCSQGVACILSDSTINIDQLGTSRLRGLMFAGRRNGDRIGGGDAGNIDLGGISTKTGHGRTRGLGPAGDVDGDGRDDILIGALVADPRRDPNTGTGVQNGGEAYLIYGSNVP